MKCIRKGCKNDAVVDSVYGILPCLVCQKKDEQYSINHKSPEFYSLGKMDRFTKQRDKHLKDFVPIYWKNAPNPEFIKAYPAKAKEVFTKEELKKYQ
jgi:hypothetical protein